MRYNVSKPPVIAIDFDGTISPYNFMEFNRYFETMDDSFKPDIKWTTSIKKAKKMGARLILYTCRENERQAGGKPYLDYALDYLDRANLLDCFDAINGNIQEVLDEYGIVNTPRKPVFDYLIDDLALVGTGIKPIDRMKGVLQNDEYFIKVKEEKNNV